MRLLHELPTELLHVVVRHVRAERGSGLITLPGLVADARNRRACKLLRTASADVPAEVFDAAFEYDTVEGELLPRLVRGTGAPYPTGGVHYRNACRPSNGLLIARRAATGRVYVMTVHDGQRSDDGRYLIRSEARFDAKGWCTHDTPVVWTPASAQDNWMEARCEFQLVTAVLDVREFVLTLCGKNANYDYNLEHFDRLVFHPRSAKRGQARGYLPTVSVELAAYCTKRHYDRQIVAELARYNSQNTWKNEANVYNEPYTHQRVRRERSADVRFAVSRFDDAATQVGATRGFLSREIHLIVSTPCTSLAHQGATYRTDDMVLNRHDRETGPPDNVPSLSKLCGFYDTPAHAECCGWYVNLDSHGLSPEMLKLLVGRPRRNDMETYRRALAEHALMRAERLLAARTALVAASSSDEGAPQRRDAAVQAGVAARAWKRDAAVQAGHDTRVLIDEDNKTYSTGEKQASEQPDDDEHKEADAQYAADNRPETPRYDSDDDWDPARDNDRRTRTQRMAERRQEAVGEMEARERESAMASTMLPSDDEDDL